MIYGIDELRIDVIPCPRICRLRKHDICAHIQLVNEDCSGIRKDVLVRAFFFFGGPEEVPFVFGWVSEAGVVAVLLVLVLLPPGFGGCECHVGYSCRWRALLKAAASLARLVMPTE